MIKKKKNNILNSRINEFDNLLSRLSDRKKNNIYNSMIRPLYQEALRSFFLILIIIFNSLILLEIIVKFYFPFNLTILSE